MPLLWGVTSEIERSNSKQAHHLTVFEFEACYKRGAMQLLAFREPPAELEEFCEGKIRNKINFQKNIRQYNAALAFPSLGYKKDDRPKLRQRHRPLQLHGVVYHMQSPVESDSAENAHSQAQN